MKCKYCLHTDDKHESHCPTVNRKMAEWEAGYGAAKDHDTDCEPVVERMDNGELIPCSDLTYGLGWAVATLESMVKT